MHIRIIIEPDGPEGLEVVTRDAERRIITRKYHDVGRSPADRLLYVASELERAEHGNAPATV